MNLYTKREIPFSPPDISEDEIAEVVSALRSGWITTGPKTKLLESKIAAYCNTSKAVCLNSATACLEMTLRVLGVGPGDEVITSAYTYTASASVICHVGATPVLVDVKKDSFEMDYDKLADAITENTKVIIPIDLAGIICDYERIFQIVQQKKSLFHPKNSIQEAFGRIAVVSDASHAFGASKDGKMCGEIADFTCFSFHAVKNFTTAEGGAVTWKEIQGVESEQLYKEYMLLSLHGQTKDALSKTQIGTWEYDIISPAYKCNMTDILASIGLGQFNRYEKMLNLRKQLIQTYDKALNNLNIQVLNHYGQTHMSSGHLYMIRLLGKDIQFRNDFIMKMAEHGIATNVHYKPLPMLTAYKNLGFDINNYPNAYQMYENEVTLPLYSTMQEEDIQYVIEILTDILMRGGR